MTSNAFQAPLHALETVVSFFLIGWLGYCLTKRKWFTDESADMLSRLVAKVIIPVNLLYYINTTTTKEEFLPIMRHIFAPAAAIAATMAIAAAVARLIKIDRSRRSVFITAFSCSNTINIGLPINLALFGVESLPGVLIYYMANTILFWTAGNYLLASDSDEHASVSLFSRETLVRMFPPPILAFLAGLALMIVDIKIPNVLASTGKHLGSMTTPLSIMCIGITIFQTGLSNLKFDRDLAVLSVGRFVISPLVLLAFLHFLPVDPVMRNVFIIQSSLPPMSSIILLTIAYKTDSKFAAVAISLLTFAAVVTIPITRWLLAL